MILYLGTTAAYNSLPGADREVVPGKGRRCEVVFPDDTGLIEAVNAVIAPSGIWAAQSPDPPQWVSSDSAVLAATLGEHYGVPVRDPLDKEAPQ